MHPSSISIIIPAHNSAATLAETLASLLKQTTLHWEAIIVDDGSVDETEAIAKQFAVQDSRIHVLSQPNQGVSAARNAGAQIAQAPWLLFLDSDDWVAPDYITLMTAKIESDSSLDVVHCGWVRVAPDGTLVGEKNSPNLPDLFPIVARYCPFAIHACVVKQTVFTQAGGFDTSLMTCEDWDLWQRIARQGARFGGIPEILAYYRMRPKSLSGDGTQFFKDGLRVLRQGCTPDPRITNPQPNYQAGLSADNLSNLEFYWASWPAGLVLGLGRDASPLLSLLHGPAPGLDPHCVAANLFESTPLPSCSHPAAWWQLWEVVCPLLQKFLNALEELSKASGLAQRVARILERMVLEQAIDAPWPLQVGKTYGVLLEITQPIVNIVPPEGFERLYGVVTMAGRRLGTIELPICDGVVSELVLKDSIADQYYWSILGYYYNQTIYRQQNLQESQDVADWQAHHNQVGWATFLQDLWDRPAWGEEAFYNAAYSDPAPTLKVESDQLTIEVSDFLSDVSTASDALTVLATVGGIAIGQFTIPTHKGCVSAQSLRATLTLEGGLELCRSVVREACIGQPIVPRMTLRQRLALAAKHRLHHQSALSIALSERFEELSHTLILRHRHQLSGSSGSRWATLPSQAAEAILTMAQATRETIAQQPNSPNSINRVMYAADSFIVDKPHDQLRPDLNSNRWNNSNQPPSVQTEFNNRDYFETLFATQPDPWKYTTNYEQVKYEQTLSLLPKHEIQRALELACAEGHFTEQLAPHVQSLIATDISQIAVERTAQRCSEFPHIQFRQLDMAADPLPDSLQLIVCSEVLYYIGGWENLRNFAKRVVNALEPGGYFLTAHAHLVVDEPDRTGYNWDHPFGAKGISDTFMAIGHFKLVNEIHTPLYRIQLFQKKKRSWLPWSQSSPSVVKLPQPTAPPEAAIHQVLWQGGTPQKTEAQSIVTDRLPILMYHRVAPEGAAAINRWRVTPEAFEAQLSYLRDAGYYTVPLETWQRAIITKNPLPGRAILLTFDDGYLDFLTYAYPLLQAYGFSATVFLVADHVGQSNQWDNIYGEDIPLMTWAQIRQLQAQGIEFGSHSASHRPLTSLTVEEIVKEGLRSRTILTQELGTPVQTIAYPYGDVDPVVQHLIGACGYTIGLSCRPGQSSFQDSLLSLPRIEVEGSNNLQEFVKKLSKN
ncbi:trifunctional glycosyltransferase/class I SAM-dependent methyltransferase/polysaccharide deacetylase [Nodosilinea sp. FACHB-13]|uniref:trifunctional glycosyltransferase/class I SAM-dependent methyltransferase/polysaccharide deacetylase n=1 Tax=Cyanophyceae TaxID=3028117 RepID=UPI0016825F58|nr:trifunctional glycosyltransferase/class I SAM-dependent methyltransferase/polysaccharide deacetylase [Nodosilinea sp. FACHB-13]MBD2109856.1 glycosyltransferase [Nodosilinea sp. FACHB-13]